MAELLEGNRKEIIKYLCNDDDAWNWEPYFEFQVSLRLLNMISISFLQTTLEDCENVSSLEKRLKKSITGILECNLASEKVFDPEVFSKTVNVMICSLVFDVVCTDVQHLEIIMRRALSHLEEDGLMIVQGSLGEQNYTIGSAMLPVLDINQVYKLFTSVK